MQIKVIVVVVGSKQTAYNNKTVIIVVVINLGDNDYESVKTKLGIRV